MIGTKVSKQPLAKKRVLITSGPTWISIDPMRVISNRATGKLGHSLALALAKEGARVTLLEGPVTEPLNTKEITIKKFCFYEELKELLQTELKKPYALVIHNAAVSDYQLKRPFSSKLNSDHGHLTLDLVPTEKLISNIKKLAPKTFLIGFKLEDFKNKKEIADEAKKLAANSQCDLVVANTLKGGYKAYLVNKENKILGHLRSRQELTKKLICYLKENLPLHRYNN